MTLRDEYRLVRERLDLVTDEADAQAREIMAHVYGLPMGELVMRLFHEADRTEETNRIVRECLKGRPLAYVLGSRAFYGADYYVDERVLIPRQDSECVAQAAISLIKEHGYETAADVGCGSGCLGITLLRETPVRKVIFTDISEWALDVARRNAKKLAPGRRSEFRSGDMLNALPEKVDLIICNPPYICRTDYEMLDPQIRDYEPALALVGGDDGLAFYRRLARGAAGALTERGAMVCEIGDTQRQRVMDIMKSAGFTEIRSGCDLAGRPRFILVRGLSGKEKVEDAGQS